VIPLRTGGDGGPVKPPEATTITISRSSVMPRTFGDTVQLSAMVRNQNGQVMTESAGSMGEQRSLGVGAVRHDSDRGDK